MKNGASESRRGFLRFCGSAWAAIALVHENDALYATGVYGGDQFDRYFEQFGERLQFEYFGDGYTEPVVERTIAVPGEQFTRKRIRCS